MQDQIPKPIPLPVSECDRRDHHGDGDSNGQQRSHGATTEGESSEGREEYRHREVFEHEYRQHDRSLPVAGPAKVVQQFGDDTGGRDVGDPTQEETGDHSPAENQPGDESRSEVQRQVDQAGRSHRSHTVDEFLCRIFETQHQEEEDDPEIGADLYELLGGH